MLHWRHSFQRVVISCGIAASLVCVVPAALAAIPSFTVRPQSYVPHVQAFARVRPVTNASIRTGLDGRLESLDVVPGSRVRAGQRIGRLGGNQVQARLDGDRVRLKSARSEARARSDALTIQRQRLAQHLSTRASVDQAEDALARARARRADAVQALDTDRALEVLRAPANGVVISVNSHVGERVLAGQVLATVQPDDGLWLMASVYDPQARDRLHVGMHGKFKPDDGSAAIPVRVVQMPPLLRADGGQPVAMLPVSGKAPRTWVNGETGRVSLDGRPVTRILVPNRALVMDRGHWWVLLATAKGDRRQRVTPGDRLGKRTVIRKGLHAGDKIVLDHVYRRFHRGIARRYQSQD